MSIQAGVENHSAKPSAPLLKDDVLPYFPLHPYIRKSLIFWREIFPFCFWLHSTQKDTVYTHQHLCACCHRNSLVYCKPCSLQPCSHQRERCNATHSCTRKQKKISEIMAALEVFEWDNALVWTRLWNWEFEFLKPRFYFQSQPLERGSAKATFKDLQNIVQKKEERSNEPCD